MSAYRRFNLIRESFGKYPFYDHYIQCIGFFVLFCFFVLRLVLRFPEKKFAFSNFFAVFRKMKLPFYKNNLTWL